MMNDSLDSQIREHCFLVNSGAKPVSLLLLQGRYYAEVGELIEKYKLKYHFEPLEDEWFTVWIYKKPILKDIISRLKTEPETALDHFILGCLFGYSIEEICNYIKKLKRDGEIK